ncbi:MAG: Ger(x)C family spore germination C-terminal domain-containing protein [Bacillota bacterium]|nr:Ger(x)C family spore germination C-terminal domain-containing protein [Bacillota bacterium]
MRRPAIRTRKVICLMLVLASAATATGCWDRRETNELAIAGAVALDRISEGKVLVSVEIIANEAISGGTGALAAPTKLVGWVIREEATTVPNALRNIQRRMPKLLFLGQVSTLVIGQNLAREGLAGAVDYFGMNPEIRRSIYITTCDSGSGLLQRPFIYELASRTLLGLIMNSATTGKSVAVTLNEFLVKLSEPGIEPITLHTASRATHDLAIKRSGEDVKQTYAGQPVPEPLESEHEIEGERSPESVVLDPLREQGTAEQIKAVTFALGIAAYREDKMVGFLDGNDARGYLWAVNRVDQGALEVPNPFSAAGDMTLDIARAVSTMDVRIEGGKPAITFKVNVDLEGAFWPLDTPLHEPGAVQAIEAAAKTMIEAEMLRSLQIVREEFRTDIYGFGQAIYRKNPKLWHSMAEDWNDRGLQELQINLEVRTRLRSPGGKFLRHRAG